MVELLSVVANQMTPLSAIVNQETHSAVEDLQVTTEVLTKTDQQNMNSKIPSMTHLLQERLCLRLETFLVSRPLRFVEILTLTYLVRSMHFLG